MRFGCPHQKQKIVWPGGYKSLKWGASNVIRGISGRGWFSGIAGVRVGDGVGSLPGFSSGASSMDDHQEEMEDIGGTKGKFYSTLHLVVDNHLGLSLSGIVGPLGRIFCEGRISQTSPLPLLSKSSIFACSSNPTKKAYTASWSAFTMIL